MPTWVGGVVGTLLILVVWWLASLLLFRSSGSIPGPVEVLAKFFSPSEWANTLSNGAGTLDMPRISLR